MKHAFLAVALLAGASLAAPTAASAQGVRLGLKAGGNLSNLAGDLTTEDGYDNKFGFHAGLMLNAALTDDGFFSVQPEVLYSQKGYQYNGSTAFGLYKYSGKVSYNYLDVPVLARIKAGGLFFEAGPQFSYLLNVKDESTRVIGNSVVVQSAAEANLDNVNRGEIGFAAGLGYESEPGLLLGLRYAGAFSDIAKNSTYRNDELRNARNSVFQLYLGYLIGGK